MSSVSTVAPSPAPLAPGLLLCIALAGLSLALAQGAWLQDHGLGALTLAIALGMLVGNTAYPRFAPSLAPGVAFSKQRLLRLGVVLYGLRLTFQDVAQVGVVGVAIDALVLASTLGMAAWLGPRRFGLPREAALLIGAGSAICGAAAIMAAGPVLRARSEQVAVAVATVVVFGTLSMFAYPLLYPLVATHLAGLAAPLHFGVFTGSTVHEVAQVVVAGRALGGEAESAAVITKMVRVMMLAPVLLGLSLWRARGSDPGVRYLQVPWFAFAFLSLTALNSLWPLPAAWHAPAAWLDDSLLAMAMAALGLTTQAGELRRAGWRPLLLGATLLAWLVLGGAAINLGMRAVLG